MPWLRLHKLKEKKLPSPEENEVAKSRHDVGQESTTRSSNESHELAKVWHLGHDIASQ